jgi:hypothetical protein
VPLLALVLLAERLLAPVNQMSGDVQASGCHGHLLAAWRDAGGVQAVVDGHAVNVSTSTRGTPAVACGASSWLVVWPSQDFGVDGRRVRFDGTLLAQLTIFRGPFGASEVAAAYGRDEFLVAWADGVTIRATRVTEGGGVIDAPPLTVAPNGFFVAPRATWTGSTFFVAWAEKASSPILVAPVRLWGTRVSADGGVDPVSVPILGSGARGAAASLTTSGDRITMAWVAEHGVQTCVDVADVGGAVTQFRCSGDAAGDGVPVLDQAQILWSRGELVLVWRELMPDFSSVLHAARVGVDKPPFATVSSDAFGAALAMTSDGVAAVYFSGFPVNVFSRTIQQDAAPGRRRAAGH